MSENETVPVIYKPGAFINVILHGKSFTMHAANTLFDRAVEALKVKDWDLLEELMTPISVVERAAEQYGDIEVRDNTVFYRGQEVFGVIIDRILAFRKEGQDIGPIVKFLEKLMQNPSKRAVDELYTFLEHKFLPLTEDGDFLAYKGLNKDYYSISSGRAVLLKGTADEDGHIYNGIGEKIEIPRNQVDDNKEMHCSYGLHAGSYEYASGFSQGQLVIVKINPANVVSIPSDCGCQKLRCCAYEVIGDCEGAIGEACYKSNCEMQEDYDDYVYEEEEDECEEEGFFLLKLCDALGNPIRSDLYYKVNTSIHTYSGEGLCKVKNGVLVELASDDEIDLTGADIYPLDPDRFYDMNGDELDPLYLYEDDESNFTWEWNLEKQCFYRIKPNDKKELTYADSLEIGMIINED